MGQVIETEASQVERTIEQERQGLVDFSHRSSVQKMSPEQWLQEWDELAAEIGKVWPAGLSAVDAVAEQRC